MIRVTARKNQHTSNGNLRGIARLGYVALITFVCASAWPQAAATKPAIPLDPVDGILAAFKTHQVVTVGEGGHNNEQGYAVRMSLIRDPRFPKVVNDIVVEFGNSRYQDVMDRYARGEDVPYTTLRQVWQNTREAHEIWDVPIYEEFFRAVREINAKLPKKRKLRVLLGDVPIDWDQIKTQEDLRKVVRSDTGPAGIIEREVIAKGRRALVLYGDMHSVRRNTYWMKYVLDDGGRGRGRGTVCETGRHHRCLARTVGYEGVLDPGFGQRLDRAAAGRRDLDSAETCDARRYAAGTGVVPLLLPGRHIHSPSGQHLGTREGRPETIAADAGSIRRDSLHRPEELDDVQQADQSLVRRSGVHADAAWAHEDQRRTKCRFGRREAAGVLLETTRR
jgi:hypothetical protein